MKHKQAADAAAHGSAKAKRGPLGQALEKLEGPTAAAPLPPDKAEEGAHGGRGKSSAHTEAQNGQPGYGKRERVERWPRQTQNQANQQCQTQMAPADQKPRN